MTTIDTATFRHFIGRFPTGVAVILTEDRGQAIGATVSSLTSVSLNPPLVLVCLGLHSRTGRALAESGRFSLNLLTFAQRGLAAHFAKMGTASETTEVSACDGYFWLPDCNAGLACVVEAIHPGGDHRVIIGRVVHMHGPATAAPALVREQGAFAQSFASTNPPG